MSFVMRVCPETEGMWKKPFLTASYSCTDDESTTLSWHCERRLVD